MQITNDTLSKIIALSGASNEEMLNLFVVSACEVYLKKQVTFEEPTFNVRETDKMVNDTLSPEFIAKIKAMRKNR